MSDTILTAHGLKKYFPTKSGLLHAVDDVSFSIKKGSTLGVVGESGCGKSTLGRVVLRLTPATSGEIEFEEKSILQLSANQMKQMRKEMQIIFQDPYSSLNPRMNVFGLIAHPLRVNHLVKNKQELEKRVYDLMEVVGLSRRYADIYPHQLDGGRRQRIGIARALAMNPKFIVCDEPVSALDVSIQAQILNLMMDLQNELNLTYMFITHNLSVVRHISDDIMVMYMGQCVELAPGDELFQNPKHPYTKALLNAVLEPNVQSINKPFDVLPGEVSSPINPRPGCRFAPRCSHFKKQCEEPIDQVDIGANHFVRCVMYVNK